MRDNSSHDRPPARFITAPELGGGMSAEGLDAIFSPRSIAVIGASRHRGKIGYEILRNLIVNEYQGILYPVNPNATGIHGIRAYPRISDVPDPVDLAVITVPADLAVDAAKACGEKGVRGLVVITAGFREIGGVGVEGESGHRRQVGPLRGRESSGRIAHGIPRGCRPRGGGCVRADRGASGRLH